MSSLFLQNFTLSQTIQVHTGAVRCLSIADDMILTGSYDSTLFLLKRGEKGYEPVTTYSFHSAAVYSCIFSSDGSSFFSGDKSGVIYHSNLDETSKKVLGQHGNAISSLDTYQEDLISGSWDSSAKI